MKSPFYFIVSPTKGRRYDNLVDIGGHEVITSTSNEDHMAANRFAIVLELPMYYDGEIEIGDMLLVHHNVFRIYNDMQGRERSGFSHLVGDKYIIEPDQYFLYKHNGKWKAHDKYCFVKPSPIEEATIMKIGTEEPLVGTIRYINNQLIELGLSEGDKISFAPNSEYEFTIDGEKLYRMFTNNITIAYGR